MRVKINKNTISITHKLKKDELYKINKSSKFYSVHIFKKPIEVVGFTSMCEDLKHILLIDYDYIARWIVEKEALMIQKKYKLTPFYLFTTNEIKKNGLCYGNYHLICLTKMSAYRVFSILQETHADVNFSNMPLRTPFKSWVLRTSNKGVRSRPKYLGLLGRMVNLNNEVSEAHLKFLDKLYNVDKIKYNNLDGLKTIYKNIYETTGG